MNKNLKNKVANGLKKGILLLALVGCLFIINGDVASAEIKYVKNAQDTLMNDVFLPLAIIGTVFTAGTFLILQKNTVKALIALGSGGFICFIIANSDKLKDIGDVIGKAIGI